MSADPYVDGVQTTQGWNRYGYVGNRPTVSTDPSGYLHLQWGTGDHKTYAEDGGGGGYFNERAAGGGGASGGAVGGAVPGGAGQSSAGSGPYTVVPTPLRSFANQSQIFPGAPGSDYVGCLPCVWYGARTVGSVEVWATRLYEHIRVGDMRVGDGLAHGGRGDSAGGGGVRGGGGDSKAKNKSKDWKCHFPEVGFERGVDAYLGLGSSFSIGVSINPRNGQATLSFSLGFGIGLGGGARWGTGPTFSAPSTSSSPTFSGGFNATFAGYTPGPVGIGQSTTRQLFGASPGAVSVSPIFARPSAGAIFANVSAQAAASTPALYETNCGD